MTSGRHQNRRFAVLLSTTALLLVGLAIFCVISSGEGKIKIYFYSSETNINNFKSLKMEFDRYLSRFGPYELQPFRFLTVPKDVDALMSVGFGMAKLAFASENAFDELKGVNPRLCSKMKVLAKGEETLRLILAVPQVFTGNSKKTIDVIRNMPIDSDGKRRIRMLGLDGWRELNVSDRSKLES